MKLREINKLVEKKNFFGIKKEIEQTIDKYEDDAKEVRIDIVISFENLANKLFDKIEKLKQDKANDDLSIATDFDAITKKIVGLQNKFMGFIRQYKDNQFQKDIITKLIKHIEEIVVRLEDALDDVKSLEDALIDMEALDKEIQKASGGKASLKRKVPAGLAQDINTRKHKIAK